MMNGEENLVGLVECEKCPYFDDVKDKLKGLYIFTYSELQDLINRIATDIGGDGEYGEHIVTDYIY